MKKDFIYYVIEDYKEDLIYEEDLINEECDLIDYCLIITKKQFKKGGYFYDDYEDDEF
ncbi:hypothetical protein [Tissierella sp.]|uniref:hypothetical protein n=1 Tax=Tissierella sp. TaxID=41274 RepID=UPI00302A5D7B